MAYMVAVNQNFYSLYKTNILGIKLLENSYTATCNLKNLVRENLIPQVHRINCHEQHFYQTIYLQLFSFSLVYFTDIYNETLISLRLINIH